MFGQMKQEDPEWGPHLIEWHGWGWGGGAPRQF